MSMGGKAFGQNKGLLKPSNRIQWRKGMPMMDQHEKGRCVDNCGCGGSGCGWIGRGGGRCGEKVGTDPASDGIFQGRGGRIAQGPTDQKEKDAHPHGPYGQSSKFFNVSDLSTTTRLSWVVVVVVVVGIDKKIVAAGHRRILSLDGCLQC